MGKKRRNALSSSIPRKRRKSAQGAHRPCRLLELPLENLDDILSYVITIPWDPIYATFHALVVDDLFPASALHVNHLLRMRSIELITRNTLWMHVTCQDRKLGPQLLDMKTVLPVITPVHRMLLPETLPGVTLKLGRARLAGIKRVTRTFNEEAASIVFPFNCHSFSILYARIMDYSKEIGSLIIESNVLPKQLQSVVEQQINPLARVLRFCLDTEVIDLTGKTTLYAMPEGWLVSAATRLDAMMSLVQELDNNGRILEATLLCLYHGRDLPFRAGFDPVIGMLGEWASQHGGLSSPDWLTEAFNVERMRLVRTLFYIERRALLGYFAGSEEYHKEFINAHYRTLANPYGTNGGCLRWLTDPTCTWFGLPDHEIADLHHVRAVAFSRLDRWFSWSRKGRNIDSQSLGVYEGIDFHFEALPYALEAWSLDMRNSQHVSTLQECLESDPTLLTSLREYVSERSCFDHIDVDGKARYWVGSGTIYRQWTGGGDRIKYLARAQEVAKLADVAYDERRGDDLPKCEITDRAMGAARKLLRMEDVDWDIRGTRPEDAWLDWNAVGWVVPEMYVYNRHSDIAPWHNYVAPDGTSRGSDSDW